MKTTFFILSLALSLTTYAQENYLAKFNTLNPHINGIIGGSATIYIDSHNTGSDYNHSFYSPFNGNDSNQGRIKAFVRLFAGSPKAWHMQHVFVGNRCPDLRDDLNFDGFIDIQETYKVVGNIIIPLDGDISSQKSDLYVFPVANESGSYTYTKEAGFEDFMWDLQAKDRILNDNIIKLGRNEDLNLEGKVVIIQGVASDVVFPETVASYGSRKIFQTFPVACGVFKRTL